MTVIVLSKHGGYYHLTGDGRTSQDWMGIASDNTIKVREGKNCIYGTCGKAAAKIVIAHMLAKTQNPIKLLQMMHHKDYKDLLQDSTTLVASPKYGCYTIQISNGHILSGKSHSIVTWDEGALPQIIGSGFLSVRTLLSTIENKDITLQVVNDAILSSYKVNHTIGGKITTVKIKAPK